MLESRIKYVGLGIPYRLVVDHGVCRLVFTGSSRIIKFSQSTKLVKADGQERNIPVNRVISYPDNIPLFRLNNGLWDVIHGSPFIIPLETFNHAQEWLKAVSKTRFKLISDDIKGDTMSRDRAKAIAHGIRKDKANTLRKIKERVKVK